MEGIECMECHFRSYIQYSKCIKCGSETKKILLPDEGILMYLTINRSPPENWENVKIGIGKFDDLLVLGNVGEGISEGDSIKMIKRDARFFFE
ncbi:MAG: hypothetical protein ACP5MW_00840 [Thermoplasmata archaeon]